MKLPPHLMALAMTAGLWLPVHAAETNPETADTKPRDVSELEGMTVTGQTDEGRSANHNRHLLDAQTLEDEQAQNLEDMIRYVPGVSIVDMGRFGNNGFNIRGLEGDRVALTVDGLSFGETVETAVAYEFFRAGRGGIDVDTLKEVEIIKGADAITAGSGALGGAVVLTTKDPSDFLNRGGNDTHFAAKLGYTDATDEVARTLTFANRTGIVESMVVYTQRDGHEASGWFNSTAETSGTARRTPDPVDSDSTNLLAKVDLAPNERHRFGVVIERARAQNDVNNLSRAEGAGYLERWGDDTNDRDRYGVRYQWQAGNAWFDQLEWTADRTESESRGITRILAGSGSVGGLPCTVDTPCRRAEDRLTDQTLTRSAVDLSKAIMLGGLNHELIYGLAVQEREIDYAAIDTRWNNLDEVVTVTVDPAQVARTDVQAWSLYLRDSVQVYDDRLTLTAGVRYDRYDYSPQLNEQFADPTNTVRDASFASPTWQLGADFSITQQHSVWAQAGRGFRAPTVADMYSPTATTQRTLAETGEVVTVWSAINNPNLESEESLNLEAGYRWQTDRTRVGVSIYRDQYSNFIEQLTIVENEEVGYETCSSATGECTVSFGSSYNLPANIGEVTVKGVEMQGLWLINGSWMARAAASYNEGDNKDGPLASINPANGVLGLQYRPSDRWNLTANLTHSLAKKEKDVGPATSTFGSSVTPVDIINKADGYTVMDLFGTLNIIEGLRLTGGVYNLFDEEYYLWARVRSLSDTSGAIWGGVSGDGIGRYSEPGRNYRVTMAYSF